jgi:hypothetical protein
MAKKACPQSAAPVPQRRQFTDVMAKKACPQSAAPVPQRRQFTDEFRREAVQMMLDGHSAASVAHSAASVAQRTLSTSALLDRLSHPLPVRDPYDDQEISIRSVRQTLSTSVFRQGS